MYKIIVENALRGGRSLPVGTCAGLRRAEVLAAQAWRDYVNILARNNRRVVIVDTQTGDVIPFTPPASHVSEARELITAWDAKADRS